MQKKPVNLPLILGVSAGTLVVIGLMVAAVFGYTKSRDRQRARTVVAPTDPPAQPRPDNAGCWPAPEPPRWGQLDVRVGSNPLEKLSFGSTLNQVEETVGAPGRQLSGLELEQHCQDDPGLARVRQTAGTRVCYYWSNGVARLYVFFTNARYSHGYFRS